jgi:hypothetical protein
VLLQEHLKRVQAAAAAMPFSATGFVKEHRGYRRSYSASDCLMLNLAAARQPLRLELLDAIIGRPTANVVVPL